MSSDQSWRMEWRKSPPFKADCLDREKRWYTAKVMMQSLVTRRIKVCIDGADDESGEWFECDDVRLQVFMTRAVGGKETGGVYDEEAEIPSTSRWDTPQSHYI